MEHRRRKGRWPGGRGGNACGEGTVSAKHLEALDAGEVQAAFEIGKGHLL